MFWLGAVERGDERRVAAGAARPSWVLPLMIGLVILLLILAIIYL